MSGTDDPAAHPLAALTAALKALSPNPSTTLIAPTFDRNSTEQYEDFQLFIKSVNSWFTLQHITAETTPDGTSNSTRLEYFLNFLENTGCKKYERWRSRRKRIVPKNSWTTNYPQWTMKCLKGVEFTPLRMFVPTHISNLMNLLTVFTLLLIDVTCHQKKKRNAMFNTDL